jgi:AcrR family transcriptional regulator
VLEKANDVQAEPQPDRRRRRREATKAEILDAAWEMVREQGLAALSLRDLAANVGMRAPSLYQYFSSKHAIYDAMFAQAAQQALDEIVAADDGGDLHVVLRAHAHRFFNFAVADPVRAQLLFQRTIPGFEPTPESYAPAVTLVERLREFFAARRITNPDALDAWTSLSAGLVSQQLANDPGGDRYGRLVDRFVDMFLFEFGPKEKKK